MPHYYKLSDTCELEERAVMTLKLSKSEWKEMPRKIGRLTRPIELGLVDYVEANSPPSIGKSSKKKAMEKAPEIKEAPKEVVVEETTEEIKPEDVIIEEVVTKEGDVTPPEEEPKPEEEPPPPPVEE